MPSPVVEVMIENRTNSKQRLPVADEDIAALGGDFIEFLPFGSGAKCRALLTKPQWDRMRLQYPQVQEWVSRNKFRVL